MDKIKTILKELKRYILKVLKWIFIAAIIGILCGVVGAIFHISIEKVTDFRFENSWMIFFLPVSGLLIVLIYKLTKLAENTGTNDILYSVRHGDKPVSVLLGPAIFLGTLITHAFGGSAGREGAALQLGGSIASGISKPIKLNKDEVSVATMCGMSAVFSSLFSTPVTAAIFALEVATVGIMKYSALLPCLLASLVGYKISLMFGIHPLIYNITIPEFQLRTCVSVGILAILCGLVSIVFCFAMHKTTHYSEKYIKNSYLRVFLGGTIIVVLTLLLGTGDYNGAGMFVLKNALGGFAKPEACILKIIFTAITLSSGYRGGEVVPTFFIGATFGCVIAPFLGIDAGFGAAIGLIALFCGVVNCPMASIILSVELFGAKGLMFFAIASSVSYIISGYCGLYNKQKIVYSKSDLELVNTYSK